MTPSNSLDPNIGGRRNYLLRGSSYNALKSQLAVTQNFATFEWLLWQQGSFGGEFKSHC